MRSASVNLPTEVVELLDKIKLVTLLKKSEIIRLMINLYFSSDEFRGEVDQCIEQNRERTLMTQKNKKSTYVIGQEYVKKLYQIKIEKGSPFVLTIYCMAKVFYGD